MADFKELWVKIGAKTEGLKRGLAEAKREIGGFGKSIGSLGLLIAGAFSVSVIAAFNTQASRLAREAEEVRMAFKALNDPNLLSNLKSAVSGTVTELNLMKAAVRADSLGIPLKQLSTYFEFAERQAGRLGISTEQAVEAIVQGIGNKAPLAFRALGISSVEVEKNFRDLETETLTIEEVSDRAFVMIAEKLDAMGLASDSVANSLERQTAAWSDLVVKIGHFVNILANGAAEGLLRFFQIFQGRGTIDAPMLKQTNDAFERINKQLEAFEKQRRDRERIAAQERNVQREIARIIKRTDEEHAKQAKKAAEDALKAQERYNKLAEDAGRIVEKRGDLPYIAPGVPLETMPEPLAGPDLWADAKNNLSSIGIEAKKTADSFEFAKMTAQGFADEIIYLGATSENLKEFAKSAKGAAKEFVASQIGAGVAAIIKGVFVETKNPWLGLVLGSVAGGAAAAIFNRVVPSFAQGGIVQGKQLAMVGDNPSGTEAIIPKEQWGKMGANVNVRGIVRGRDLYWVMQNENEFRNKAY